MLFLPALSGAMLRGLLSKNMNPRNAAPPSRAAVTASIAVIDAGAPASTVIAPVGTANAYDGLHLVALAIDDAWRGDFAAAVSLIAECDAVCEVTGGSRVSPFAAMFLGALRGNQAEVTPLIEGTLTAAEAGGQGSAVTGAHWAAAQRIRRTPRST